MITSEQIIIRFKKLWSSILYWKEKVDQYLLTAIHFKQTRQPLQVIYRDRNESWLHDRIQIQTFQGGRNKMKSSFAFGATFTIQRRRFLKTKWKHSDETRIANWKTQLGSKFFQHSQPVDVCCRPPPPTSMVSGRYLSSPTNKNKTISLHFMTLMLG